MNPKKDITDDLLIAIRRVIRAVYLHSRKLNQSYSLTGPQVLVLKEIVARKRISPGELAKQISLSQATIADIVKRLEKRGLVTRVRDGSGLGRTFSLDGDSRGYPVVALSFQRVKNGHVGIIHGNQCDRNSGGEIWSRDDFRND